MAHNLTKISSLNTLGNHIKAKTNENDKTFQEMKKYRKTIVQNQYTTKEMSIVIQCLSTDHKGSKVTDLSEERPNRNRGTKKGNTNDQLTSTADKT